MPASYEQEGTLQPEFFSGFARGLSAPVARSPVINVSALACMAWGPDGAATGWLCPVSFDPHPCARTDDVLSVNPDMKTGRGRRAGDNHHRRRRRRIGDFDFRDLHGFAGDNDAAGQ